MASVYRQNQPSAPWGLGAHPEEEAHVYNSRKSYLSGPSWGHPAPHPESSGYSHPEFSGYPASDNVSRGPAAWGPVPRPGAWHAQPASANWGVAAWNAQPSASWGYGAGNASWGLENAHPAAAWGPHPYPPHPAYPNYDGPSSASNYPLSLWARPQPSQRDLAPQPQWGSGYSPVYPANWGHGNESRPYPAYPVYGGASYPSPSAYSPRY